MSGQVRIEPFTAEHVPAVRAFNQRLSDGQAGWRFPSDPVPDWLPQAPGSRVYQQFFLAVEEDAVRGGYILKHREVSFRGDVRPVGTLELPLSEGTVNPVYSLVGYQLLRDALRRQPLLFGVGLGGEDVRIARLLRAMGWRIRPVPFHFLVLNGTGFLREFRYWRTSRFRSLAMDLAAASGFGWLGAKAGLALLHRAPPRAGSTEAELVERFGDWADDLWEGCGSRYSMVGVRDLESLHCIYPPGKPSLLRLKVASGRLVLGYVVMDDRQLTRDRYFGNLRVATLLDGLARPEDAEIVLWHAVRFLVQRQVDVMVSNQSHPAWCAALRSAGLLRGPTNFHLATAPGITGLLEAIDPQETDVHVNRGDGPAPWGVRFHVGGSTGPSSRSRPVS